MVSSGRQENGLQSLQSFVMYPRAFARGIVPGAALVPGRCPSPGVREPVRDLGAAETAPFGCMTSALTKAGALVAWETAPVGTDGKHFTRPPFPDRNLASVRCEGPQTGAPQRGVPWTHTIVAGSGCRLVVAGWSRGAPADQSFVTT